MSYEIWYPCLLACSVLHNLCLEVLQYYY
jgi:hypothetical protein